MAYTFDRLSNLFAKPEQENANIFDRPSQQGTYGQLKTTTGGDISSGESGGGTTAGGEAANPRNIATPTAQAIKRNVSRAQTPQAVNRIGQDIQQAQQNLQNEANQYVQGYQNKDYGVAAEDVEKAVAGDQGKFQDVAQRFQKKDYGQVDRFAPKTDYEVEDAYLLGSEGGVKRLLGRESGPRYTAGEGAFDVSLLRRNPQFQLISDQLQRQQRALTQEGLTAQEEKTKAAQQEADTRYKAATEALQASLTGKESETLTEAEKAAQQVNQRRQALRAAPDTAYIDQARQQAMSEALKDIMAYNPRAKRFFDSLNLDPNQFYQVGKDVSYEDVLTPEQAARFNRIQDILGTGKTKQAGLGAGEDQAFNVKGLQQTAVEKSMQQRSAEDKRLTDLVNNLKAQAKSRAQEINLSQKQEDERLFRDNRIAMLSEMLNLSRPEAEALAEVYDKTKSTGPNPTALPVNVSMPRSNDNTISGFSKIISQMRPEGQFQGIAGLDPMGVYSNPALDWTKYYSPGGSTDALSIAAGPYQKFLQAYGSNLNMRDFISERPEIYAEQTYTPEEVDQINAALEDLGSFEPRAKSAVNRQSANLRAEDLRNVLRGLI